MLVVLQTLLFAGYVLIAAEPTLAAPPPHATHEMTGQLRATNGSGARIALRLDCLFYDEGDISCTGRLRCRTLIDLGDGVAMPRSRACDRASAVLDTDHPYPSTDGFPSTPGSMTVELGSGGECSFKGTVPYVFDLEVAGMFGHYECVDQNHMPTETGVFGFRARSIGKPFHRLD
jgi:hypothetical protein